MARIFTGKEILSVPIKYCDCGAKTIKEYLIILLGELWEKQELFNGKRPWGTSGWDFELYRALLSEGFVAGKFDEDDWIEEIDIETANDLIRLAIQALSD